MFWLFNSTPCDWVQKRHGKRLYAAPLPCFKYVIHRPGEEGQILSGHNSCAAGASGPCVTILNDNVLITDTLLLRSSLDTAVICQHCLRCIRRGSCDGRAAQWYRARSTLSGLWFKSRQGPKNKILDSVTLGCWNRLRTLQRYSWPKEVTGQHPSSPHICLWTTYLVE